MLNIKDKIFLYREVFATAQPFKYVVIDEFFEPEIAEKILRDFPSFDRQKAVNELGVIGGKAVQENLSEISETYRKIAQYLKSNDFLKVISKITGIGGLMNDDIFYGGGTHENLDGQELDPHVDFNLHGKTRYHRRLNLIVYLNKEWSESWGGCLELHSNPRDPEVNQVTSLLPLFNRCVIFETNEYSWHGFPKIQLPENKKHLSRKSLSIYLYTKDRPISEKAPPHTTFYIPRHLPAAIQPGSVLSESDYQEIKSLLRRRDDLIKFYQDKELKDSAKWQNSPFGKLQNLWIQLKRATGLNIDLTLFK
jgi:hypothetical protein